MAQFDTWTGRTLGEPTEEQWEALKRFAGVHGRYWRNALRESWQTGNYGAALRGTDDPALLQQVRNTFGSRWLTGIDITKER